MNVCVPGGGGEGEYFAGGLSNIELYKNSDYLHVIIYK